MAQVNAISASNAKLAAKPMVRPAAVAEIRKAAPATLAADKLVVSKAAKTEPKKAESPASNAVVPGEDVRNTVAVANTVLGPVVTANQGIKMLAETTFKNQWLDDAANWLVRGANTLGKFKFLQSPVLSASMRHVSRALPFIGAGILAFDGYATIKTFTNPEASGTRKALTAGRFLFNAIATGVSFIPGAGFIYSLAPGLIGNIFEVALARLNGKEAAAAKQ